VRVIHLPAYTVNPYNRLLAEALAKCGLSCELWEYPPQGGNPRQLLKRLRKADLVHWHWLHSFYQGRRRLSFVFRSVLFASVMAELRIRGVPQVVTMHNLLPHEAKHKTWHRRMARVIGCLADRLLVHHRTSIEPVCAVYGGRHKIRVTPLPHYGETRVAMTPEQLRNKWELRGYDKWAIMFGGIRKYKRLELAVDAAREFSARGIGILIAGKCPDVAYVNSLEKRGLGRVRFLFRELTDSELDELIVASSVVLLPYSESLTSAAAHLAASRGRPMVCATSVAFAEFIERGFAIEAKCDNPALFAEAALRAIAHPPTPAMIKDFQDAHNTGVVGTSILKVYAELGVCAHVAGEA